MNRSASARILLVARRETLDPVAVALNRAGYAVTCADTAARATEPVMLSHPEVLVIDPSAFGARTARTLTALAEDYQMAVLSLDPSAGSTGAASPRLRVAIGLVGGRPDWGKRRALRRGIISGRFRQ